MDSEHTSIISHIREKRLKEKVTVFTQFHNLIRKAKIRIVKGIPPLIYLTNQS